MIKFQKPQNKKEIRLAIFAAFAIAAHIGFWSLGNEYSYLKGIGIFVSGAVFLYCFSNAFMNIKDFEK
jgi:hypothetical protein